MSRSRKPMQQSAIEHEQRTSRAVDSRWRMYHPERQLVLYTPVAEVVLEQSTHIRGYAWRYSRPIDRIACNRGLESPCHASCHVSLTRYGTQESKPEVNNLRSSDHVDNGSTHSTRPKIPNSVWRSSISEDWARSHWINA